MSKIQSISGTGIPLVGSDIDTDRIIPARFLRSITFEGLGEKVFDDDRQQMQRKHPFDLPEYQGANLLVVNANFGCGSSREHAPQAIAKWGIQAIIGESFAEIFLGNCVSIGIPCVSAKPEDIKAVQEALKANPKVALKLDLESMKVHCGELTFDVNMNAGSRQSFITGLWDSCGQLIDNFDQIRATAAQLPYLNWAS